MKTNYYTKNKFYNTFTNWLINRDSKQPPQLLELLSYYDNAEHHEKIDKEEFVIFAERQVLLLKAESFWEEENN